MAAFTITVTNRLNLFGPAGTDLWNAYNWNAFKWGEGTKDLTTTTRKVVTNTLTPTDLFSEQTYFAIAIANAFSPASDMSAGYLRDRSGYYHVFPGSVTNSDDRVDSSWAADTAGGSTWTQQTASSTSWSGT